jgi:LacI family transcriptional regulator
VSGAGSALEEGSTTLTKTRPLGARATIRDVAALAGVSAKSVSRVVNDLPGSSPALRARVLAAIERLDYRPDLTASRLRRLDGRSATIGLVLEDAGNPFSSTLQRAIEDVALRRGVLVLAGSSDEDAQRERHLVAAFSSRRVDGLVIVPGGHDHSYLLSERKAGTAIVFVDRQPSFFDADSVVADNVGGVRRGVRQLIMNGHRRIGYLGDLQTIATAALRYEGYREELESHSIPLDERLVQLDVRSIALGEAATTKLLSATQPPTALFCGQNLITIGAYRVLRKLGLQRRVALIGFDDILLADMVEPGITVVAQDPALMGRIAAELLFRRLDGDDSPTERQVTPTRLIRRGSGELAP